MLYRRDYRGARCDDEEFGDDRLVSAVQRHRAASASETAGQLMAEAAHFAGGSFGDDNTLLLMAIE